MCTITIAASTTAFATAATRSPAAASRTRRSTTRSTGSCSACSWACPTNEHSSRKTTAWRWPTAVRRASSFIPGWCSTSRRRCRCSAWCHYRSHSSTTPSSIASGSGSAPASFGYSNTMKSNATILVLALVAVALLFPDAALAHNVSKRDAAFVVANQGTAMGPFLYLGAKHMVTGYDHILFLVGVIFFLYRLKDVVQYVSLFTIGHSVTLLAGVLGGIHANSYIVDAIIGFSVVYKAFDNMNGFKRFLGIQPNTKLAVLIFGLFHGFGLATKQQEF